MTTTNRNDLNLDSLAPSIVTNEYLIGEGDLGNRGSVYRLYLVCTDNGLGDLRMHLRADIGTLGFGSGEFYKSFSRYLSREVSEVDHDDEGGCSEEEYWGWDTRNKSCFKTTHSLMEAYNESLNRDDYPMNLLNNTGDQA